MRPIVCGRFYDKYIIAYRFGNKGAVTSRSVFDILNKLSAGNANVPEQLITFLARIGLSGELPQKLNDLVQVVPQGEMHFGLASYEITKRCNYCCRHCVLGEKKAAGELPIAQKRALIETIRSAGCMYLQITGGEPILASGFKDVYRLACSLGMIVKIQTNGSLLSIRKNQKVFERFPPQRIVISIYGGTEESYQNLTRTPGSFSHFLKAIEWLEASRILVRANIIVTQYNEHEIDEMVEMANKAGFEYFIYPRLTPTFQGDPAPMDLTARSCSILEEIERYNQNSIPQRNRNVGYKGCWAGQAFFHVTQDGEAMPCQSSRRISVNLVKEGVNGLVKLSDKSRELLVRPGKCDICQYNEECSTCPPNLELFQEAGSIPSYICKKHGF